jgi:hypothetical protein
MEADKEHYVVDWIPGNKLRDTVPDFLIILALLSAVSLSIMLQLAHPETNWFMRSGALMVLTGAILEYRNSSLMRRLDTTSIKWAKGFGRPAIFEPHPIKSKIAYIAHAFVILGTFIAAYGDIIASYAVELSF